MMSASLPRFWTPSWWSVRCRPSDAASTCVPMLAIPANWRCASSKNTATFHTSKGGVKKPKEKRRHPTKRARRWIVEVAHSWFNRFRKLLVRYEKLEHSFLGLNHLAAAIIAFRKVPLTINIIYG